MSLQVSVVMLGVQDLDRAKRFYVEGMGAKTDQDHPGFVRMVLGDGAGLALYQWAAVAKDVGVSADGSGFRGFSLHYTADTRDEVDTVLQAAEAAGATILKPATAAEWGGYSGTFSDPDGFLWKVATNS
ncbi:VOC family protein [Jiangella muralis]|uniref:VOC family protein n=1 Tax=Jiangella muralis TaxID=702383 RepID=UPI00069D90C3|nr:VOC family protein [Jiangella muralis]